MNSCAKNTGDIAGMIARLGYLSYSEGFVCGLTAAQWTALRYFAKANKFSKTLLAFADYHATTRGTASQTVKSLVSQGLLSRTRSLSDGRSAHFDLTDRGLLVHGQDPIIDMAHEFESLSQDQQEELVNLLKRITSRFAVKRQRSHCGYCENCIHMETAMSNNGNNLDYFCREKISPIEVAELNKMCIFCETPKVA